MLAFELPEDSPMAGRDVSELVASLAVGATMEAPLRDIICQAVALSSSQMFRLAIPVAAAAALAALMLRGVPLRDVLPHQQSSGSPSS